MRGIRKEGRPRVRWIGQLVAVALVVGAATAFAQLSDNFTNPPAPVPGHGTLTYLTMTGSVTGKFTGGVAQKGHEGAIAVLGLDAGLTVATDQNTGLPTGRAACDGVHFRKPTDRATPLLLHAAGTGENITSAYFNEYQTSPSGQAQIALQVKLTNARITSLHHVTATTTGAFDDLTLVPAVVRFTWKPSNTVSEFTCRAGT
jgi:type VI secretion system Hcp family effector